MRSYRAHSSGRATRGRGCADSGKKSTRRQEIATYHRLRTVFFGTPDFAVSVLRRLAGDERFDIALVVTQPDRPSGRGRRVESSPVKRAATELGLPVYQPATLRDAASRQPLVEAGADFFVVAAYGLIFGRRTLAVPRLGCVNVHASLLPCYRGASPITAAILNGDAQTGVSLMLMDTGLDTGPVFAAAEVPISPDDTTESLASRLAELGALLVVDQIPAFASGELIPERQPSIGANVTRPLIKSDGWLDWTLSAEELERRVRAMWPWPRAWTTLADAALQVHQAAVVQHPHTTIPGLVIAERHRLIVGCGRNALELVTVQPAGGRPMPGAALISGRRVQPENSLGSTGRPEAPPPIVAPVTPSTKTGLDAS